MWCSEQQDTVFTLSFQCHHKMEEIPINDDAIIIQYKKEINGRKHKISELLYILRKIMI